MRAVAVIGSGTWGTAIAHLIAGKNVAVRMWTRGADVADAINATHRNPRHLPDVELDWRDSERFVRGVALRRRCRHLRVPFVVLAFHRHVVRALHRL